MNLLWLWPIPRIHVVAVAVLSLVLIVLTTGNIRLSPERFDSSQNFAVGITLGETGTYGLQPQATGYHKREPVVPFLVAGYHVLRSWVGLPVAPLECLSEEAQRRPDCIQLTAPYRLINVLFIVGAAVCAFILTYWLAGNAAPAYGAYLLTVTSGALYSALSRFVTEAPAAALMALVALFLYRLLARGEIWSAVGLGIGLAALVLTKVIFSYFWVIISLLLIFYAVINRKYLNKLIVLLSIMLLTYFSIVGSWMMRNYYFSGNLQIVQGRSLPVLGHRNELNKMRIDEFWAGFLVMLPLYTAKDLVRLGVKPESFTRYDKRNPYSFRVWSGTVADKAREQLERQAVEAGKPKPSRRELDAVVKRRVIQEIMSNPLGHLRTTVLLATTRNFPESGFGSASPSERLASVWGISWPSFGYNFSRGEITLFNAATTLSIILLPFVMWFGARNLAGLVVAAPVYYIHAMYAAVSHFLVRYAEPQIPLRNVALCVVVYVVVIALLKRVRKLLGKQSTDKPPETLLESA